MISRDNLNNIINHGNFMAFEALIKENSFNVNSTFQSLGTTPLIYLLFSRMRSVYVQNTADEARIIMLDTLLANGADVNLADKKGVLPLNIAIENIKNNVIIITKLVNAGSNVNRAQTTHEIGAFSLPISSAIYREDFEIINILLNAGADINGNLTTKQSIVEEYPALLLILQRTLTTTTTTSFRKLLELGADPNVIYEGKSLLMHIMNSNRNDKLNLIEALLAAGAKPDDDFLNKVKSHSSNILLDSPIKAERDRWLQILNQNYPRATKSIKL